MGDAGVLIELIRNNKLLADFSVGKSQIGVTTTNHLGFPMPQQLPVVGNSLPKCKGVAVDSTRVDCNSYSQPAYTDAITLYQM